MASRPNTAQYLALRWADDLGGRVPYAGRQRGTRAVTLRALSRLGWVRVEWMGLLVDWGNSWSAYELTNAGLEALAEEALRRNSRPASRPSRIELRVLRSVRDQTSCPLLPPNIVYRLESQAEIVIVYSHPAGGWESIALTDKGRQTLRRFG